MQISLPKLNVRSFVAIVLVSTPMYSTAFAAPKELFKRLNSLLIVTTIGGGPVHATFTPVTTTTTSILDVPLLKRTDTFLTVTIGGGPVHAIITPVTTTTSSVLDVPLLKPRAAPIIPSPPFDGNPVSLPPGFTPVTSTTTTLPAVPLVKARDLTASLPIATPIGSIEPVSPEPTTTKTLKPTIKPTLIQPLKPRATCKNIVCTPGKACPEFVCPVPLVRA